MRVTVASFSLGFDSAVVMGGVTPRYLEWWPQDSVPHESYNPALDPTVCRLVEPWPWSLYGGL